MIPMDKAREAVERNLSDRKGVLDGVDDMTRADLIADVTVDCVRAYLQAIAEDAETVERVAAGIARKRDDRVQRGVGVTDNDRIDARAALLTLSTISGGDKA